MVGKAQHVFFLAYLFVESYLPMEQKDQRLVKVDPSANISILECIQAA